MADAIDGLGDIDARVGPQPDGAAPVKVHGHNLAVQPHAVAFENDQRTRLQFLARVHQGVPFGNPKSHIPNPNATGRVLWSLGFGIWDLAQ